MIGGIAAAAGLTASTYTAKKLYSKEKVRMSLARGDIYVPGPKSIAKTRHIVPYVEFSETVFILVPVVAKESDGALSLVHRANESYNSDVKIKGDLANRTVELFSMLYENQSLLKTLEQGKILDYSFKLAPAPDLFPNTLYKVPVSTNYKSLEEAIAQNKK